MIPIRLSLHNFMSYRDNVPSLYFDGIHTACISGENGNGKSSLIDAMTWALWGQTRAKSDDDLIHLGETETEVEFDFAVGKQRYRIIRKHAKPKGRGRSGQTILEFQIADGNGFKPITGDNLTQTQQKIIDVLHMDYDTFVNSAYLRQGHADEFTLKKASDRKQVLADILGLSLYDELEGQAKEMVRQQEMAKAQLESAIKDIIDELAQKPAYEQQLKQAETELSGIEEVIRERETRLNSLRSKKESLENKRTQLTQLQENMTKAERELQRWNEQLQQHRRRLNDYEEIIAQRPAIEEGYASYIEAKQLSDKLDQSFRHITMLKEHQHQLESAIQQASQTLLRDHAVIQNMISELEVEYQRLPQLKNELHQSQTQLNQLTELEETLRQKRQRSQELQAQVGYLESSQTQLQQQIAEVEEKLGLLSDQVGARCPLCESELGIEGRERIENKYSAEKDSKLALLDSNQADIARNKKELQTFEGEISQLQAKLDKDKATTQGKVSYLNQTIKEVEQASLILTEERQKLSDIEGHLARKDFAAAEQQSLTRIEKEIAGLNYDPQTHEQLRQRFTKLEQHEIQNRKLQEADGLVEQERESVSRAEEATLELRQSLETDTGKTQELSTELAALPQIAEELTRAETEYQSLAAQQKNAQETLWQVKGKLQNCADLEIRKREKEQQLGQASREEKIFRDLAQAFGKKGIQALLIETALPEIEIEANRLLGRMTDNRMHVKIETQRATKKGDVIETLDIKISDELGTRNYEMYSGGEAFRINFAIRIALSKLLARRAGAPLPTLIIDEGFGTQDNTGIEKIKEALNSIQDDFEKIIVITHIEELRDAFPTRINVTKTAEGSMLEVS